MAHNQFLRNWAASPRWFGINRGKRTRKKGPRFTRTDMLRAERATNIARFSRPGARAIALRNAEAAGRTGFWLTRREKLHYGFSARQRIRLLYSGKPVAQANPGLSDPD